MNVFVSGNFEHDRHICERIATVLEKAGHTITFKWWDGNLHGSRAKKAMLDLGGVLKAEVHVVYMEHRRAWQGSWVEVGAALVSGIPVYFIGEWAWSCIFRHHQGCFDFYEEFPDTNAVEMVKEALS